MNMGVFEEIRTFLTEILDVEESRVTPESYLIRDLGAESIDLMELAMALAEKFQVEVREEDIFLRDISNRFREGEEEIWADRFPFLTAGRLREIAADPSGGPILKVKDLVTYVTWQLKNNV
jgi:acyl carrier protein